MPIKRLSFRFAYGFADKVCDTLYGRIENSYFDEWIEPNSEEFLSRITKPDKDTLLHCYIRAANWHDAGYDLRKFPDSSIPYYSQLLRAAEIKPPKWLSEYDSERHGDRIHELVDKAVNVVSEATFQILFSDLEFLRKFQDIVAEHIKQVDFNNNHELFDKPGMLRREHYIPKWLQNAIFHRDKGRCQHCFSDLTRVINLDLELHFDHLLPLARWGTNDPTNFQLLCKQCNLKKGASTKRTQPFVSSYW